MTRSLPIRPTLVLALLLAACGGDAAGPGTDTSAADTALPADADAAGVDATLPDVEPDVADALVTPPDRAAGARAVRPATCADDGAACLLPWPSNAHVAVDPASATGLRVAVAPSAAPEGEDVSGVVRADGFSRVSPIVLALPAAPAELAPGDAPVLVIVAEPGAALGRVEPVWYATFAAADDGAGSALVTYPARPLAAATEHAVVALDTLALTGGGHLEADRATRVALGLDAPADADEAALFAYMAPERAALAEAGVDPAHVARLWDFTTRSAGDPRADLLAMRAACLAAVDDGAATVVVDEVTRPDDGPVAAIVLGHLAGLPSLLDGDGRVARGADGAPAASGTFSAPFRVVVPAGAGDYRVVMYAHGTGGDVGDSSFDGLIAEHGAAKVGLEIDGWTDDTLGGTIADLFTPLLGAERVANRVIQAEAGGSAVLHALAGPLGDALAAATLGDAPNPAAGRRPDTRAPLWAGGSLGGVVGLVFGHLEPTIAGGLLNVPGAGLTHWLPRSSLYGLLESTLADRFPTPAELNLVVAMAQLPFDAMDGAVWADARADDPPFLVQESIGDPVLPNVGSELVATSLGAVQVGAVLHPIAGVAQVDEGVGRSVVTQFKVPDDPQTDALAVHGFAARDGLAGQAAREQLIGFLTSVWDGAPRVTVPSQCAANTPAGSCDFSAPPSR